LLRFKVLGKRRQGGGKKKNRVSVDSANGGKQMYQGGLVQESLGAEPKMRGGESAMASTGVACEEARHGVGEGTGKQGEGNAFQKSLGHKKTPGLREGIITSSLKEKGDVAGGEKRGDGHRAQELMGRPGSREKSLTSKSLRNSE